MIKFKKKQRYKLILNNNFQYKGFILPSCDGIISLNDLQTGNTIYFKESMLSIIEELKGAN